MRTLHARSWLARLFLAWYALTLGAAMASPLVQPKLLTQVCSADGGMVLVVVDADGDVVASGPHTLDCALCLATALPAPEAPAAPTPAPVAFDFVLPPLAQAHGTLRAAKYGVPVATGSPREGHRPAQALPPPDGQAEAPCAQRHGRGPVPVPWPPARAIAPHKYPIKTSAIAGCISTSSYGF